MKLAIIYDPKCPKLTPEAYSQTYRDMFMSLTDRFGDVQKITNGCSYKDIEADIIIFFDIHSSHHIEIEDIDKHRAVKYEYFNDPWQKEFMGEYKGGIKIHKLSSKQRAERATKRGVSYIICPYENLFYRFIASYCEIELLWFPIAPDKERGNKKSRLADRKAEVLLNGHLWEGENGFHPYNFRRWAYGQRDITRVPHAIVDSKTPSGVMYPNFLSQYAGSLALCDTHICPKYSEMPLAGCVTFAQYQHDYERMGFKDGESCIYVTKANLHKKINDFKNDTKGYQHIADAGRKLIEENWTSAHFAERIYNHAAGKLKAPVSVVGAKQ